MPTLILSSRQTEDTQTLWKAAIQSGWSVERAQGARVPCHLLNQDCVLYVEGLFAPVLAEALSLTILTPEDDWLVKLPEKYRNRKISLSTLGDARELEIPTFVKSPNDKLFEAKVFQSGRDLPEDFDSDLPVLVSEPVSWEVEFRCFVLDRKVRTASSYLRNGELTRLENFVVSELELAEAISFAEKVLSDETIKFPEAVVLDVGRITKKGWAVVELNPAWGSGIYGCDPLEVLKVLQVASRPKS